MTTHKHWSLGAKLALVALRQKTYATALRQYLSLLAGEAVIVGGDLEAADSPLVQ